MTFAEFVALTFCIILASIVSLIPGKIWKRWFKPPKKAPRLANDKLMSVLLDQWRWDGDYRVHGFTTVINGLNITLFPRSFMVCKKSGGYTTYRSDRNVRWLYKHLLKKQLEKQTIERRSRHDAILKQLIDPE